MCRLIELIVRSGLVIAWRLVGCPCRGWPVFVNATTEGVVREPSALGITVGCVPSITATTELVVPRSMPTVLAMKLLTSFYEFPTRLDQLNRQLRSRPRLRALRAAGGALPLTDSSDWNYRTVLHDAVARLFHNCRPAARTESCRSPLHRYGCCSSSGCGCGCAGAAGDTL